MCAAQRSPVDDSASLEEVSNAVLDNDAELLTQALPPAVQRGRASWLWAGSVQRGAATRQAPLQPSRGRLTHGESHSLAVAFLFKGLVKPGARPQVTCLVSTL